MGLKEIVLCPTLYRELRGLFVLRVDQDQDRDIGRGVKESVECVYAAAIGQVKVDQYRGDAIQPFEAFRAASDPFNLEGIITGITQRVQNSLGSRRIVLN